MTALETLATLCAKTSTYTQTTGRGMPLFKGAEKAAYLAGLSADATNLALAKYMGDSHANMMLIESVFVHTTAIARRESWFKQREPFDTVDLAMIAVDEIVRPQTCSKCQGVGFVASKLCRKCEGTGHITLSDRAIGRALGIHHTQFKRTWKERYLIIVAYVASLDADVNRAVSRNVYSKIIE